MSLLSKAAWVVALAAGYLFTASVLDGCGPAPKYGAPMDVDGGSDAGN